MIPDSPFDAIADRFREYFQLLGRPQPYLGSAHAEIGAVLRALARIDVRIHERSQACRREQDLELRQIFGGVRDLPADLKGVLDGSLRMSNATFVFSDPQALDPDSPIAGILAELEVDTTSFYSRAHRLLKLLDQLPAFGDVGGRGVRIVRNQLLEHPGVGASNRSAWSFGFDWSSGPRVRPIWFGTGSPSHTDAGYLANRGELIRDLYSVLERVGLKISRPEFGAATGPT